jgi:hypothetical protein
MGRRLAAPALCLVALGACDGFADGRVAQLEREVRALRAAQAAPLPDVAAAFAPLRQAVDLLVQRGDMERTRFVAVAQEVTQLAALMQGFVDDARKHEVEALRSRVLELDRQIKEQNKTQGEERELLLKALDLTATKLESFLRQVGAHKNEPPPAQGERKSWQDPAFLLPIGGALALLLAIAQLLRRGRGAPEVRELATIPDVVVDAPAPIVTHAQASWAQGQGPVAVRVELAAHDGAHGRERVAQWLAAEPRVLRAPAPEFEERGALLQVRFFVHDGMSAAERASLSADVQLRAQAESAAGRRSA